MQLQLELEWLQDLQLEWLVTALLLAMAIVISLLYKLRPPNRHKSKRKSKLPPGSLGDGESKLLASLQEDFFATMARRYGKTFKTNIFGHNTIVATTAPFAKFILVDKASNFRERGLPTVEKILGDSFFGYHSPSRHMKLRKLNPFLPDKLGHAVLPLEALAKQVIQDWEGKTIKMLHESKRYFFKAAMEFVVGNAPYPVKYELANACEHLIKGVSSTPIELPSFTTLEALQESRKTACVLIDKIVSWRKSSKFSSETDLLGVFMNAEDQNGLPMTADEIHDNIFTVLYAGYETTAATLTWSIKYLTENPDLLDRIVAEHHRVRLRRKKSIFEGLTFQEIKKLMPLTITVVKETLRISNVVDFSYREVLEDIEFDGYLFPKGWRAIVLHSAIHLSSEYYANPLQFESTRFKTNPKFSTYVPFGLGPHVCLGREIADLEILIFLHHFILRYSWEIVDSNEEILYLPFRVPKSGLPIHIKRREL